MKYDEADEMRISRLTSNFAKAYFSEKGMERISCQQFTGGNYYGSTAQFIRNEREQILGYQQFQAQQIS